MTHPIVSTGFPGGQMKRSRWAQPLTSSPGRHSLPLVSSVRFGAGLHRIKYLELRSAEYSVR